MRIYVNKLYVKFDFRENYVKNKFRIQFTLNYGSHFTQKKKKIFELNFLKQNNICYAFYHNF